MSPQQLDTLNGYNPNELAEIVEAIATDPVQAQLAFKVSTQWAGGPKSISRVQPFQWGSETYDRDFTLAIDEPAEVGGTNQGPNPQEVLLAAVNSCIMATFTELCTVAGIRLDSVEIISSGHLDLRGFFGMDAAIPPGYQALNWTLSVRGDATPEQFQQIFEQTIAASPNVWNMMHSVNVVPHLQVNNRVQFPASPVS